MQNSDSRKREPRRVGSLQAASHSFLLQCKICLIPRVSERTAVGGKATSTFVNASAHCSIDIATLRTVVIAVIHRFELATIDRHDELGAVDGYIQHGHGCGTRTADVRHRTYEKGVFLAVYKHATTASLAKVIHSDSAVFCRRRFSCEGQLV